MTTAAITTAALGASASLLARAIETDRLYFEMGADTHALPGAVLAVMPQFSAAAAGAVIQRVDSVRVAESGPSWIGIAEQALVEAGARLGRIYLDRADQAVGTMLRQAGYAPRTELLFSGEVVRPPLSLSLRPVVDALDWERKLAFHRTASLTPDGHPHDAGQWVALERAKCASGMDAWLAEMDGVAVGAIGAVWGDRLLRLKNIVVHPDHRRNAVGHAMIAALTALGLARGVDQNCVFAVQGEVGEYFYRGIGLRPIGELVEWSKPLPSAKGQAA